MQTTTRDYGSSGPEVLLLHGGPGAPGYLAPVARELADAFRVIEAFQRGSGWRLGVGSNAQVTTLLPFVKSRTVPTDCG